MAASPSSHTDAFEIALSIPTGSPLASTVRVLASYAAEAIGGSRVASERFGDQVADAARVPPGGAAVDGCTTVILRRDGPRLDAQVGTKVITFVP